MFNCQSGEERYQWMHKIESAVPAAPDARKAPAKEQPAKHEEERAEVKEGTTAAAEKAKETTEEAKEKAVATEEAKEKAVATEEPKEEVGEAEQETVQSDVASAEDFIEGRCDWHPCI